MLLTDTGKLETPSNDKTWEIVKALREELVEDRSVVSTVNHTMNALAWVLDNPLENRDAFHLVIRRMAHYVREELGSLNVNLSLIVGKVTLKRSSLKGYILSAQVTYLNDKFEHSASTDDDLFVFISKENPDLDDDLFVFISKENPDLAIDLIDSDSYGNAIRYYGLAPHDGRLKDIQPLHKSDVKDYDLSRFWAIPVTEDTNPTWKTVLDTISKK